MAQNKNGINFVCVCFGLSLYVSYYFCFPIVLPKQLLCHTAQGSPTHSAQLSMTAPAWYTISTMVCIWFSMVFFIFITWKIIDCFFILYFIIYDSVLFCLFDCIFPNRCSFMPPKRVAYALQLASPSQARSPHCISFTPGDNPWAPVCLLPAQTPALYISRMACIWFRMMTPCDLGAKPTNIHWI